MNEKETAKQRMINVTRELMCRGKKLGEITVAEITEAAGVGNGMVNYHFQSKDNLMKTAVRDVIAHVKSKLPEMLEEYKSLPARERLIKILIVTLDLLAENPEISKIAILDNLTENDGLPHILSDVELFNDCLSELFEGKSKHIWNKNFIIAGFFNYVFLKAEVIKKLTGFDFYDKTQRDEALINFINEILNFSVTECCKKQD